MGAGFRALACLACVCLLAAAPSAASLVAMVDDVPYGDVHAMVAEQVFAHKAMWPGPVLSAFQPDIVVAKDGSGHFTTIQAAIDSIPPVGRENSSTLVYVKKGLYFEEVLVPDTHTFLTIVGDPGETRVRFNKYSAKLDSSGNPLGTANTGTLAVLADDFTLVNMVVENASRRPPRGVVGFQAVAFRSMGNRTAVYNSSFYSYQDTLYAHRGDQYYKNCFIFGEIDFVFGAAKAVFDSCTFYMDSVGYAAVFAQFRMSLEEDNCFVVINSHITGKNQGWLGRAWGQHSCTVIANSYLDGAISPDGWNDFGESSRQSHSFFAEHKNRGIGANLDGRVWWLKVMSPEDELRYLSTDYIGLDSWIRPLPIAPTDGSDVGTVVKASSTSNHEPPTPVTTLSFVASTLYSNCQTKESNYTKRVSICMKCCKLRAPRPERRNCVNLCLQE